jgi:hypothetical protein
VSPPEREKPAPPQDRPSHHYTNGSHSTAIAQELPRRRATSWRLPVLQCGRSDPWFYPEPGERGYAAAAHHLLELGLTPAPSLDGLRLMWKRSGNGRRMAQVVAERWGLVA